MCSRQNASNLTSASFALQIRDWELLQIVEEGNKTVSTHDVKLLFFFSPYCERDDYGEKNK
jgi:hypothetical protein